MGLLWAFLTCEPELQLLEPLPQCACEPRPLVEPSAVLEWLVSCTVMPVQR